MNIPDLVFTKNRRMQNIYDYPEYSDIQSILYEILEELRVNCGDLN
jgi:hypothetical protein